VELRQYLRMMRGQWPLIAVALLVCLLSAAFLTRQSRPIYQSITKLLVLSRSARADPGESYQGELLAKARVRTYADLVTSPTVMQGVIERLQLRDSVGNLQSRVRITIPEDTTLIMVTADAASPWLARATAEAVAEEFSRYVDGLEQARAKSAELLTVTPVQAATLPEGPIGPHHLMDLILGGLAGLALGLAAAVLREVVDGRVRDEADVARLIQAPVFSSVAPLHRWNARVGSPRRMDVYRDFASVLLRLQEDRRGRAVTVLGPTRDAGASELVANVARAVARSPLRVVLITRTGGEPHPEGEAPATWPGLFDVLAGHAPLDAALRAVKGEPWLTLLPADTSGPLRPALDPHQVSRVMAELHELADVVLFDAPPLDESVEGAVLAAYCDGALLVARPRRTRRKDLARAVETLRDLSTAPTGVFLNPIPRSRATDSALVLAASTAPVRKQGSPLDATG
jgi:succinoglycan biosynthesis transport protein ExoP